jgi:hypothetical protein
MAEATLAMTHFDLWREKRSDNLSDNLDEPGANSAT